MHRLLPVVKTQTTQNVGLSQSLKYPTGIELPIDRDSAIPYHQHTLNVKLYFLGGVQLHRLMNQTKFSVEHPL